MKARAISCKRSGDFILVNPDTEGRAQDSASGYVLGVNLGEVLRVKGEMLSVGWLWSGDSTWEGSRWIEWRDKTTKQRYCDEVHVSACLATSWGVFAKVDLEKVSTHKRRITRSCLQATVLPVVQSSSSSGK